MIVTNAANPNVAYAMFVCVKSESGKSYSTSYLAYRLGIPRWANEVCTKIQIPATTRITAIANNAQGFRKRLG